MKKFTPKEKLSKKARRELDAQKRTTWTFSPVTRTVESKKIYNRKKKTRADQEDGTGLWLRVRSVSRSGTHEPSVKTTLP